MLEPSWLFLSLLFAWLPAEQVLINEAPGGSFQATLTEFRAGSMVVSRDGQESVLNPSNLESIEFRENRLQKPAATALVIELTDGSKIYAKQINSDGSELRTILNSGRTLAISTKQVFRIRTRQLNEEQAQAWDAISESVANSDVLVALQASGSISKIEGIINSIATDSVDFDFSGRAIKVPLDKLAGLRFFSSAAKPNTPLKSVVYDTAGNSWMVNSLESSSANTLELTLVCGARMEVPFSELHRIDFSYGSSKYLADLEPLERLAGTPFDFAASIPIAKLLGPRRQDAASLPGKNLGASLEFVGSGQVTYRIPEDYSRLVGSVELSPQGERVTPCRVRILLEKAVIWEQRITKTKEPFEYDLKVAGDERLTLSVEPDNDLPSGAVVFWREPRILK